MFCDRFSELNLILQDSHPLSPLSKNIGFKIIPKSAPATKKLQKKMPPLALVSVPSHVTILKGFSCGGLLKFVDKI
jgi:hypothetical protein